MNIQKKIKKLFKIFMILLLAMTHLIPSNVYAVTYKTDSVTHKDWWLADVKTGNRDVHEALMMVNGERAFCVDANALFKKGITMKLGDWSDVGISEKMAKELALIAYFGSKVEGRTHRDWYAITQGLIWKTRHEAEGQKDLPYVATPTNPTYKKTVECWNEILKDIEDYKKVASFNNKSFKINANETLTLTDTNHSLKNMIVKSDGGLDVSIQGDNQLVIKGKSIKDDTVSIVLERNIKTEDKGTSLFFYNGKDQSLAQFKISDPLQVSLKVTVNKTGQLKLTKYNNDKSSVVSNTTFRITGPQGFDKTLTTDSKGQIILTDLFLGQYKAVETKSSNGYLIDVSEHNFEIKPGEETTLNVTNDEPKGIIKIQKDNEYGNGIQGVTFNIVADEKITNKSATKVYYNKGDIVQTLKTSKDGQCTSKQLPLGKYKVIETDASDGYILNPQEQFVTLKYKDQETSLVYESLTFENKEPKGIVTIKKVNDLGDLIEGVTFDITADEKISNKSGTKVYYNKGDIVQTLKTSKDGMCTSKQLPLGKYKVIETNASDGYLLNPQEQFVTLKYKDQETSLVYESLTFKNKEPKGIVTIKKVNDLGDLIEGVTFDIIADEKITNKSATKVYYNKGDIVQTLKTSKDGQCTSKQLPLGKYKVIETDASDGYLLNPQEQFVTLKYKDQETSLVYESLTFENKEPKGIVTIKKVNDLGDLIEGVTFDIIANEKISNKSGTKVYYNKGDIVQTLKTSKDGKCTSKQLPLGKYKVIETNASDGYLLNPQEQFVTLKYKDQETSLVYESLTFKNKEPKGIVTIKKVNDLGDLIEGATFDIIADEKITNKSATKVYYNKGDIVQTLKTSKDGKCTSKQLPLGKYKVIETNASDGYLLNPQEQFVTLKYKDQETSLVYESLTFKNKEPLGKIQLTKSIDVSKTNKLLGDAYIKGNTYQLFAKDKITNKAGTKVFYEKNQLISTKSTNDKGIIIWDNLPLGNYYIQESKSNKTLFLNDQVIDVKIDYQNQMTSKVLVQKETEDRVNMQKIQVFKSGEKEGISGFVKGLQGAEFTFKLQSEVNHVGWDKAQTYAIITTDKDGLANTPYLPYGTYLVKETKTPKDYITAPDFTISVTDDYSEYKDIEQVKKININNKPFTSQVKLVKVDKETGQIVTLNSASFKIKDAKGNYVVQKVFGMKLDTFTTNSKNLITAIFGENGTVTLPLALDAGTYTIEEIKVPEGFIELEKPIQFTITNQYDYDLDKDNEPLLTVKIANERVKGKVILTKTDKETGNAMQDVEYELTALDDIINPIDGSKVYEKGEIVFKGATDHAGQIIIDNLFMGHYELRETLTKEGYVLSEMIHDVVLQQKDTTTKEYVINISESNISPIGKIDVVKTDQESGEFLSGVVFELTTKEDIYSLDGAHRLIYKAGETVSKDTSKNGLYMTNELGEIHISDLPLGQYELKEVKTLEGYYTNNTIYDIDLRYDHSDKVVYYTNLKISNLRSMTEISKIDASDSHELEGAHLSLLDKDGKIIEEWISTKEPHIIYGLHIGEQYVLREDLAPLGYHKSEDVNFTINDHQSTKVVMRDEITVTEISKVDASDSQELEGAHLSLIDHEGNVIEEWISTKEPHLIYGLHIGEKYVLHEDLSPIGYATSSDIEFVIEENHKVTQVMMNDEVTKVDISKVDATTLKELEGAHLSLKDKDGHLIDEWISLKTPHRITGLEVGKTYILHEDMAPLGYNISNDIEFTVMDTGEVQQVVMKDEMIPKIIVTNDNTNILGFMTLAAMSLVLSGIIFNDKKKENIKNEEYICQCTPFLM